MDEDLAKLRRALEERPHDPELARRYESALRRSGRHEILAGFYQRELACAQTWTELAPTEHPLVRRCQECRRDVHFAADAEEFRAQVCAGRCVALLADGFDARLRAGIQAVVEAPAVQVGPLPLCVVPADWTEVVVSAVQGAGARRLPEAEPVPPRVLRVLDGLAVEGGHENRMELVLAAARARALRAAAESGA